MNRFITLWAGLILCCVISEQAESAEDKIIRFNMSPNGYPPFTIIQADNTPAGILYDVLEVVASKHEYRIQPEEIPRKRVDSFILKGRIDATARAREWTQSPDNFVFTEPVIVAKDVLFSLIKRPIAYGVAGALKDKVILARLGYKYPALREAFASEETERFDVTSTHEMFKRLLAPKQRSYDGLLTNLQVGLWQIKQHNWYDRLQYSEKAISEVGYRLMFGKSWQDFVDKFNQELAEMKASGQLQQIINNYR